mmetsp:Transcript_18389/g.27252  ORF Transcript_18389/g.27252 Transcript_18389/m.27252 type:complete len:234 (+) Transcript_18389:560-1261(+)
MHRFPASLLLRTLLRRSLLLGFRRRLPQQVCQRLYPILQQQFQFTKYPRVQLYSQPVRHRKGLRLLEAVHPQQVQPPHQLKCPRMSQQRNPQKAPLQLSQQKNRPRARPAFRRRSPPRIRPAFRRKNRPKARPVFRRRSPRTVQQVFRRRSPQKVRPVFLRMSLPKVPPPKVPRVSQRRNPPRVLRRVPLVSVPYPPTALVTRTSMAPSELALPAVILKRATGSDFTIQRRLP